MQLSTVLVYTQKRYRNKKQEIKKVKKILKQLIYDNRKFKKRAFCWFAEFIAGVLCIIYYCCCVFIAGNGVSILYIWPVMGFLLILKAVSSLYIYGNIQTAARFANRFIGLKWLKALCGFIDILIAAVFLSAVIFAGFVIHGMKEQPKTECDYIIVLGASVNGTKPSEILQKRIDAAYEYLTAHPDTIVIGTGGQGSTEAVSEGKCIADELEKMGISPERIMYEEKSETTVENIKFAMEMVANHPENIAVVSNGFHIARSRLILSGFTDAQVYGIPAEGGGFLTLHYILREYIVLIVDMVLGNYTD